MIQVFDLTPDELALGWFQLELCLDCRTTPRTYPEECRLIWTPACEDAMNVREEKLTTTAVLAYPSFGKPDTAERDASISGLGALLSQTRTCIQWHTQAVHSLLLNVTTVLLADGGAQISSVPSTATVDPEAC